NGETDDHDPARRRRAEAAVGQIVDQEGDGIGEGAPGEDLAEPEMLERILHQEIRSGHDGHHGGHERPEGMRAGHFFNLGDGTSRRAKPAAMMAYAAACSASFLATCFFNRRARWESSASSALARNASRPPRCSTVRRALAEMRRRKFWPSASDISVTWTRLGRKRRRVLLLAWLTLLPVMTDLPVSSQARDMSFNLQFCRAKYRYRTNRGGARAISGGLMEIRRSHRGICQAGQVSGCTGYPGCLGKDANRTGEPGTRINGCSQASTY